ncbi:cytochrome c oxidase assembly protein [Cladophialophora carrionii]|uniref:Cytochrome c oxidase assembly protein n=1 Tax=Cladophialophora carrionii TaxID=86049 RepID=A0A1C1D2G2_9EURO|nr:cytochrome c oxidase assembly protein [Cladophialophora carrionii]
MPSSCKDIRAALAQCLQNSDCILLDRHTPLECLSSPLLETLPTQCQQLKIGFRECRRGLVDMRKRFRGNAPISTSLELEGGGGDDKVKGGQLYGGRPAFDVRESMAKGARGEVHGLGFDESKTRGL